MRGTGSWVWYFVCIAPRRPALGSHWRGFLLAEGPVKVGLFIDWQNVYWCAREAFALEGLGKGYGNFSPLRLGRVLAAANRRGDGGLLVRVEVFRGMPSARHDRIGHGANRRQAAAWTAEGPGLVIPRTRPLNYPADYPSRPAREKGVDVALALGAVESVIRRICDVAIIFSHDTDLLPVPETLTRLTGSGSVETAAWISPSFHQRLRPKPPVVHHALTERIFRLVSTPVNYARPPR